MELRSQRGDPIRYFCGTGLKLAGVVSILVMVGSVGFVRLGWRTDG